VNAGEVLADLETMGKGLVEEVVVLNSGWMGE